ncbi:MAG: CoA-binding protein [Proteobacteria bacterium]|jgi:predicted CoA-binding protein|nr:CoA-binding protein [Pseudomonadota bacterium]
MSNSETSIVEKCLRESQSVALVGASPKPELASNEIMDYLMKNNYKVYPINPKYKGQLILGQLVYPDIISIPESIDMVDVFRPSPEAVEITKQAIEKKVTYIWLQLGIENEEAKKIAEANGITMIMNRCTLIEHKKLLTK